MQSFIDAQRRHIITMVETFEQSCEMASTKDDGLTSREEARQLAKIHAAANKFKSDLIKIK